MKLEGKSCVNKSPYTDHRMGLRSIELMLQLRAGQLFLIRQIEAERRH